MVITFLMRRVLILLLLAGLSSGCARRSRIGTGAPARGAVLSASEGAEAEGQASWYGDPYHGRRTASGEVFDKNKMTAAHRTLPFETWVRVENRLNGLSVDVRITDRGPFVGGRVIDLSEAAAERIDMIRSGVAPVRLTVIREGDAASGGAAAVNTFYVVQLGAFESESRAQDFRRRFEGKYTGIYVDRPTGDSPLYKVRIGRSLLREARYLQRLLKEEDGIEAIVVQME